MPTYRFENTKTGEITEELMSISEMEKHKKKKHINLLPPTQMNIVSSVGQIDSKTDSGWKDHLNRIAERQVDRLQTIVGILYTGKQNPKCKLSNHS